MWAFLLTLHLIGNTGFSLVLRKAVSSNVDRWILATVMQIGITLPVLIALVFVQPDWSVYTPQVIAAVLTTSALIIFLHWCQVKALQYLEASVFPVFYNLRIIFTTALGILVLHENVLPLQIIGGVFIFLAVLTTRQRGKQEITAMGIRWGLTAAVVISVLNMFEKGLIQTVGYLQYVVPVMILSLLGMFGVLVYRKQQIPFQTFTQKPMLALMILRTLSAYGATFAFWLGGSLSVTTYVSSLGVITTTLFGIILLKERDFLRNKIAAIVIAMIGLTCILLANLLK